MAYVQSKSHVTDDVGHMTLKGQGHDPNMLRVFRILTAYR